MVFDKDQKATALLFARRLADRDYEAALALCSDEISSRMSTETIRAAFEDIVPLDWGEIAPIDLEENAAFPFVYVVLGGEVYSEAIIIDSFVIENGQAKVANFELGRP